MVVETKMQELFDLVAARQAAYEQYTDKIGNLVAPTVLAALAELLEPTNGEIQILNVDVIVDGDNADSAVEHSTLVVECIVDYDSPEKVPNVIQALTPDEDDTTESNRLIKVAIPLSFIFDPKDDLKNMLQHTLLAKLMDDATEHDEELTDSLEELYDIEEEVTQPTNTIDLAQYKGTLH